MSHLDNFIVSNKIVGLGNHSKVFLVMKSGEDDYNYVYKELGNPCSFVYDEVAGRAGVGPKTIVYKQKSNTYLIQERLTGTLTQYLSMYIMTTYVRKKLSLLVLRTIEEMEIFHNDLNSNNVMYKLDENNNHMFYLIDFTWACSTRSLDPKTFNKILVQNSTIQVENKPAIRLFSRYDQIQICKKMFS